MRYIDITQTIADGMKRYPTDPEVRVRAFKSLGEGNSCNLSELALGTHTATHIDAPRHILDKGRGVDSIGFDKLICDVLVTGKEIFFKGTGDDRKAKKVKGIIFKKGNGPVGLTFAEAGALLNRKISLVGTEDLSIENSADKSHPVHRLLLRKGVVIIENLKLDKVRPGRYRLICLPLKIKNGDGAPARAVLIDGQSQGGRDRWRKVNTKTSK